MKHDSKIAELLYDIFSINAINSAAISEQLEDVKYCSEHHMNHLNGGKEADKWEKAFQKAKRLVNNDETFTIKNIKKFQSAVNDFLEKNPKESLYNGMSEIEHFAVRKFYYFNSY